MRAQLCTALCQLAQLCSALSHIVAALSYKSTDDSASQYNGKKPYYLSLKYYSFKGITIISKMPSGGCFCGSIKIEYNAGSILAVSDPKHPRRETSSHFQLISQYRASAIVSTAANLAAPHILSISLQSDLNSKLPAANPKASSKQQTAAMKC